LRRVVSFIRVASTAAAIAVLSLGTMACEPEEDKPSGSATESTEEPAEEPTEEPTEEASEMREQFDEAVEEIEAYAEEQDLSTPSDWHFIEKDGSEPTQCTDQSGQELNADDKAYFYCPPDDAIFVGEASMADFEKTFGEQAPSVGMAHEWGHHLQFQTDLEVNDQETQIAIENQADCISGAWYRDERGGGLDDIVQDFKVGALLFAISELEGPERTHGTVLEREGAFFAGATQGLDRCEKYVPDHPFGE
jgi:predicted metalloprotease